MVSLHPHRVSSECCFILWLMVTSFLVFSSSFPSHWDFVGWWGRPSPPYPSWTNKEPWVHQARSAGSNPRVKSAVHPGSQQRRLHRPVRTFVSKKLIWMTVISRCFEDTDGFHPLISFTDWLSFQNLSQKLRLKSSIITVHQREAGGKFTLFSSRAEMIH